MSKVRAKGVRYDVRTGKEEYYEFDFEPPPSPPATEEGAMIDLKDLAKLIKKAKVEKWI